MPIEAMNNALNLLTIELADVLQMPNVPPLADLKITFVQESMLELQEQLRIMQNSVNSAHDRLSESIVAKLGV